MRANSAAILTRLSDIVGVDCDQPVGMDLGDIAAWKLPIATDLPWDESPWGKGGASGSQFDEAALGASNALARRFLASLISAWLIVWGIPG